MKVNELNVVVPSYAPNTATTNRIMAFIKGFSEQGIITHVTFLISDNNGSKFKEVLPNTDYKYMWDSFPIKNRFLIQLQLEINSRKYVKALPFGATVLLLWPSSRLMELLVSRKDLKVFYEETEFPELYLMKLFNIKSYLQSLHKLKGIFAISSALRAFFIEQGVSPDRAHIVNMIVDTTRFENVKKEESVERYIAYCGTVTSNKDGVDDLIKAFAIVRKTHSDVKLYIIGFIPQISEEIAIFDLVKKLGIEDAVHFTGVVPYQKMPQILKNAEVLALARPDNIQAKYGFPTKLGEYLLTGNPAVLTSVGDLPLFLKDGENALISEPNNYQLFAEKLNWALNNKDEAAIIGQRGRTVAEECFNYKTESIKIVEYIQE